MSDRDPRLSAELRRTPVPPGSRERAVDAALRELAEKPTGRRRRLVGTLAVAVAVALGLTAPGNAAIDWFAGLVSLKEEDDGLVQEGAGTPVARGTTPEGTPYEVSATYPGAGRGQGPCIDVRVQEQSAEGPDAGRPGVGFCGLKRHLDEPSENEPFDYLAVVRREGKHTMVVGAAPASTKSVEVRYREDPESPQAEAPTDVYPIAGEVERRDGTVESLFPFTYFVSFLPPGIAEVTDESSAVAHLADASGEQLGSIDLAWTEIPAPAAAGSPEGPGMTVPCARASGEARGPCERALSGELRRIDRSHARPLPDALERELAARGYEWFPATDADRGAAFELRRNPHELAFIASKGLPHSLGIGRVGRISGPGVTDGRLVYLHHQFSPTPGSPSGWIDPEGPGGRSFDPLERPLGTVIVDYASEEVLLRLDY